MLINEVRTQVSAVLLNHHLKGHLLDNEEILQHQLLSFSAGLSGISEFIRNILSFCSNLFRLKVSRFILHYYLFPNHVNVFSLTMYLQPLFLVHENKPAGTEDQTI